MRVLFTTWAWPSHYFPMVPIAWALRSAGHDVRMTSQPDLMPTMRLSGLPSTVVGVDRDVQAVYRHARELVVADNGTLARGAAKQSGRGPRFTDHLAKDLARVEALSGDGTVAESFRTLQDLEDESIAMFRALWLVSPVDKPWRRSLYSEVAQTMVDDLLALAHSWRPDLIVWDPLTYAGPIVGKLLGIPTVRNMFGPDVTYFITGAGLADLLQQFGIDDLDLVGTATVDPTPPSLQLSQDIAPAQRIFTRYVPYNGLAEVPSWLPDEPSKPRICLTWGTSIHRLFGDQAFLPGEILPACAKLADERGAELVLAITKSQRPLLPEVPPNVRVLESVPLDSLLATCTALIHQGGAGTMLTALRHGLPQLVLPQLFDEAVNAVQLVATGAGSTRLGAGLPASELLSAGHELLDNPAHRQAAHALRDEIRAQPSPADIVSDLAALAS